MDEIKVSQLDAVDEVRDTDVIMEISGGANKKATIQQVKDNIVKDEYGTADDSSYAQSYQNEHNVVVSADTPTSSERVHFQYSGNLFGVIPETQTKNGITLTNNGNGTFNLNGTATAQTEIIWWKNTELLEIFRTGNKWSSFVNTSNNDVMYQISTWNGTIDNPIWVNTPITFKETKTNQTITASSFGTLTRFNIQISNGATINLSNLKIAFELTDKEIKNFEPYTDKYKSIQVDNKTFTEAVSVGTDSNNSRVWFKKGINLVDKSTILKMTTINATTGLPESTSNFSFATQLIKVKPNTDYYVKAGPVVIYAYDTNKTFMSIIKNNAQAGTFNTGTAEYIRGRNWLANNTNEMNTQINNAFIYEGSTDTTYEPYITPSINVNGEEIYSTNSLYGISLYSNSSGTHEAFTLSEDIKHFREIEVTFGRSSWTNMKQKLRVVPQQSGTTPIGLIALYPTTDGNSLVLASAVFEIGSGGTNATFPRNTSGTIGSTGFVKDTATYVNVYEVVGYK